MSNQRVYQNQNCLDEIPQLLVEINTRSLMIVCSKDFRPEKFIEIIKGLDIPFIYFTSFESNPQYESVVEGIELFNKNNCDTILAVGGGSALDVAKCIKLYSTMEPNVNYLKQEPRGNDVKLIAIPTTAGTGSEATRFAVIYFNGEKQTVTHISLIPGYVFLDPSMLNTLPMYQRKVTMLDALCHGIESFWSVNSTDESKKYSELSIKTIIDNIEKYLNNIPEGNANMLLAANYAGKAIDITQTTAGHAMSYSLTSKYKIAHGHAAALCLPKIWKYMNQNLDKCIEPRGKEYLETIFIRIANCMNCVNVEAAIAKFEEIFKFLDLSIPVLQKSDLESLSNSVNPIRLKNNPVELDKNALEKLYIEILS